MAKFNFQQTSIPDLYIVEPVVFGDSRGYFMETYNSAEFFAAGLTMSFVQDNQSMSRQGVLRGLHFQQHSPQGKLVRVLSGEVFDVAVDIREDSATYGKWEGVVLSAENKRQLYIPEGFAHGFLVLSETAEFSYKCSSFYDPSDQCGIIYSDPELNINWEKHYNGDILVIQRDLAFPTLTEWEKLTKERAHK